MQRTIIKNLGEMPITVDLGETKIKLDDSEIMKLGLEIAFEDPMQGIDVAAAVVKQLGLAAISAIIERSESIVEPEPSPLLIPDSPEGIDLR